MARQFICTEDTPVVQTKAGKVRGFILDGIYHYYGIKYADARRFMMPEPVKPWEGIIDANSYGYVSPMLEPEPAMGDLMVPHRYWPKSEDCQYLNIWSPAIGEEAKKPVMVWLHGGGFAAGSSIEQVAYDGFNLCNFGDVVVVSINHRLNILGYLDLSPYGEKYQNSGNAGNADLVAALQWIHDNIAAFGGDPDNVTLFGQSGGGGKISSLLQTPAADGLFHKCIIMSGIADGIMFQEGDSRPLIDGMLKELGLTATEVDMLETLPYEQLAAAYNKVSPDIRADGGYIGCAPVPNGYYVGDPRQVGFTKHAATIPVMAGTVLAEFGMMMEIPHKHDLTADQQMQWVRNTYGDSAEQVAELFHKAYPEKYIADAAVLDTFARVPTCDFVEKKVSCSDVPTYNYVFSFEFPIGSGRVAWHCSDIPFAFHNTNKVVICNKPGVSDRLENQIATAWVNFAKYGDPNHAGLPKWPVCEPGKLYTMILDENCRVELNHDKELYAVAMKSVQKPPRKGKKLMVHR